MRETMKYAYASEQDLYPVRLCFEVLIRNHKDGSGLKMVETILNEFPQDTPLSNLVKMVVDSIKIKDFLMFKTFLNTYKPELMRDGQFPEYLDRIAKYYFNDTIKQANPMQ
jgi:hypothetical protein|tara:strand:+ start:560 stop:892 length:333 start_codon:yes stop_codon:yes gene_type:complete